MICEEFELWLDEGRPARRSAEALDHARECPLCGGLTRAENEVEAAFRLPVADPAPGFDQRVMARVRTKQRRRVSEALPAEFGSLPWWVTALAQPIVALASLLAALLIWRYQDLWTFFLRSASAWNRIAGRLDSIWQPLAGRLPEGWTLTGLLLLASTALAWASWQLFRWWSRRSSALVWRSSRYDRRGLTRAR